MKGHSSLRRRLLVPAVLLAVLPGVLIGTFSSRTLGRLTEEKQAEKVTALTTHLAAACELGVLSQRPADLVPHVDRLFAEEEVLYVAVYDAAGSVLHARIRPEERTDLLGGARVWETPSHGPVEAHITDREQGDIMILWAPVLRGTDAGAPDIGAVLVEESDTDVIGSVAVGITLSATQAERTALVARIVSLILATSVVAGTLAWFFAHRMSDPIVSMTAGAKAIGAGDLDRRLQVMANDEIGELARAFNAMTGDLKGSRDEMEAVNLDLEHKVAARTADLQTAYDDLKVLDEAKDVFISTVSHELRSPLTSIRSFAEILTDYADEDPEQRREFLGIIRKESERLTRLVNEVLDLAKMEGGTFLVEPVAMDAEEAVRNTVSSMAGMFEDQDIEVTVDAAADLQLVSADPDRLAQVLHNLLSNAAKFAGSDPQIEALLGLKDDTVEVRIRDHGPGVPDHMKAHVFERFRQIHGADPLAAGPRGTGLGLAISKEIVERQGGQIWIEDTAGGGTTVVFSLPLASE